MPATTFSTLQNTINFDKVSQVPLAPCQRNMNMSYFWQRENVLILSRQLNIAEALAGMCGRRKYFGGLSRFSCRYKVISS